MESAVDNLKKFIQSQLSKLNAADPLERGYLYDSIRNMFFNRLEEFRPELSLREKSDRKRELETAIRQIESNFRSKPRSKKVADKQAADVAPIPAKATALAPKPPPLATAGQPSPALALHPLPQSPATPADRAQTRSGIRPPSWFLQFGNRMRVGRALMIRASWLAASRDRSYYMWLLLEPMLQVGIVVLIYWLMDHVAIFDMPAIPFAILGCSNWLMFRTVMRTTSVGYARDLIMLNFPPIDRFILIGSKAVFLGVVYLVDTCVLLWLVWYLGYGSPIDNIPGTFWWWLNLWILAFALGLVLLALQDLYPILSRVAPILTRVLFLLSAVVMVTEQIPPDFKFLFLWNPVAHCLQLIRSEYFVEYLTIDADPTYVYWWVIFLLTLGLVAERAGQRRVVIP